MTLYENLFQAKEVNKMDTSRSEGVNYSAIIAVLKYQKGNWESMKYHRMSVRQDITLFIKRVNR